MVASLSRPNPFQASAHSRISPGSTVARSKMSSKLMAPGGRRPVAKKADPRSDVFDDEGGLVRPPRWVDGAGHRAERHRTEVGREPGGGRGAPDAEAVAVAGAGVLEAHRQRGG